MTRVHILTSAPWDEVLMYTSVLSFGFVLSLGEFPRKELPLRQPTITRRTAVVRARLIAPSITSAWRTSHPRTTIIVLITHLLQYGRHRCSRNRCIQHVRLLLSFVCQCVICVSEYVCVRVCVRFCVCVTSRVNIVRIEWLCVTAKFTVIHVGYFSALIMFISSCSWFCQYMYVHACINQIHVQHILSSYISIKT